MYNYTINDIKFPIGRCGMIKIDTNSYCPKDFGINDKDAETCEFDSSIECLKCWKEALEEVENAELIFHKKEENHEIVTVNSPTILVGFKTQSPDNEIPEVDAISGKSVPEVLHKVGERFGPEIEKCVSDKLLGENDEC